MTSNEVSELIEEIRKISQSIETIEIRLAGMETAMQEIVSRLPNEKENFPMQYSTTSKSSEDK